MQVQFLKKNVHNYTSKETVNYLINFVMRAFMIALLFLVVSISLVLLVVAGDTLYNRSQGNNVVPLLGGYIIVTPSMVPTIKVNDAVLVKRVDNENLTIGDIITFASNDIRYEGLIVTHRIVGTQSISSGDLVYRTKGDNNRIEDSAVVSQSNIYGKVILKFPKLGYVKNFLQSPIGFTLFIIFPILAIFYIIFKNLINRQDIESLEVI